MYNSLALFANDGERFQRRRRLKVTLGASPEKKGL
jgi:hypothetical protein